VDATEAQEGIEDAVKDARTRKLALLIAALAALLAIVGMQDDNSAQDAVQSNIQASDLWAFFQAKSLRQFTLERQSEVLKIEREGAPPSVRRPSTPSSRRGLPRSVSMSPILRAARDARS
jgi:hypothetical protein